MAYDKKALRQGKGFAVSEDDEAFLKANTDPWKASASGEGYQGRRWDDDTGYKRGEQSMGGDESSFLRPSQSETDWDAPHERLSRLIDGQVDQPAGEILGGGGPVSDNKVGGVGAGKPRYKSNAGIKKNDSDGL